MHKKVYKASKRRKYFSSKTNILLLQMSVTLWIFYSIRGLGLLKSFSDDASIQTKTNLTLICNHLIVQPGVDIDQLSKLSSKQSHKGIQ